MTDPRPTLRIEGATKLDPDRLTVVSCVLKADLSDPPPAGVTGYTCADCKAEVWMSDSIRRLAAEVIEKVVVCYDCGQKRAEALTGG